jgi:hypothetical protein
VRVSSLSSVGQRMKGCIHVMNGVVAEGVAAEC